MLKKLKDFARSYIENPNVFFQTKMDQVTNMPESQSCGLFYGHAGLGWLFSEVYKITQDELFIDCLNV